MGLFFLHLKLVSKHLEDRQSCDKTHLHSESGAFLQEVQTIYQLVGVVFRRGPSCSPNDSCASEQIKILLEAAKLAAEVETETC